MAEDIKLNEPQKKYLLQLARTIVEAKVTGKPISVDPPQDAALFQPSGCFVTLHVDSHLRGCIGTFQADGPIYQTVREMAQAALQDSRFLHQPLRKDELNRLVIEISVLSPLSQTDDPLSLELGKHGIYIKRGHQSGCFLPQVATETGWTKEEFLSYCCTHKAGLPREAWKDKQTTVYLFTAEIFGEGRE
ncbi:MAG: AmmeMemoRadiSam system protein A [Phycisphaerae bacterium]